MASGKVNLIAAACEDMGIGFNGVLPWKLRKELRFFHDMTKHTEVSDKRNAVIMGRKTWFGIPDKYRPLPDRINVVLTSNPEGFDYPDDIIVCTSLQEAIRKLKDLDSVENMWIIGGCSVYKEAMNLDCCYRVYLTEIHTKFECDVFFPPIPDNFQRVQDCKLVPNGIQEENGIQYQYTVYEKAS